MAERNHEYRMPPADPVQAQVVWKYELLRYMRSWRLIASIAIVLAVLALIYLLPPAVGSPYKGTVTDEVLRPVPFSAISIPSGAIPGMSVWGYATLNESGVVNDLTLLVNGTEYPQEGPSGSNWVFLSSSSIGGISLPANAVVFAQNMTGSIVTASYRWHISVESFDSLFLGFANILIIICATFFGADSIVGEFQNRTGYLMFPNPVRRSTLFMGKFSASMTAAIFIVGLFYLGITLLSVLTLGGVDGDIPLSFGFALEYLLAVMAVAYLISSILKGSTGALVLTFFMFVMILPIVDGVAQFSGVKIPESLTFSGGVITYSLQDPYPKDSVSEVIPGFTLHQFYPDPVVSAIVMAAYAVIALAISMVLFKRKQLAG